jgi:hypothetical protein
VFLVCETISELETHDLEDPVIYQLENTDTETNWPFNQNPP